MHVHGHVVEAAAATIATTAAIAAAGRAAGGADRRLGHGREGGPGRDRGRPTILLVMLLLGMVEGPSEAMDPPAGWLHTPLRFPGVLPLMLCWGGLFMWWAVLNQGRGVSNVLWRPGSSTRPIASAGIRTPRAPNWGPDIAQRDVPHPLPAWGG